MPRLDEHLDRLMGRVLARRIRVGYFVIKEVLGIIKPVEVRDYARLREVKAEGRGKAAPTLDDLSAG